MKFDLSLIYTRPDGSYVINKGMYHVPNEGEWAELWAQVGAYAKEHPEVVMPEPTPEELAEREFAKLTPEAQEAALLEQAKAERAAAVAAITVTVDGMTFDGDETAQERMARTVTAATATGASMDDTTVWVLHDNTVATPTIRQLATALRMAGEAQTALWTKPYEA
jgi:biopolymer transport protein ExbD